MIISKKIVTEIFSIVFAFFFSVAVQGQALPGPDPLQMENAPDLGYQPVPHGLNTSGHRVGCSFKRCLDKRKPFNSF